MNSLAALVERSVTRSAYRWYSRHRGRLDVELTFSGSVDRFPDVNDLHHYMHHYFHHRAPSAIRAHRAYFREGGRGFGEDALHAMWWLLLKEYRPQRVLEIGVYRGQIVSLWCLIAQLLDLSCEVHALSPFTPAGDAVSSYEGSVDYLGETVDACLRFGGKPPRVLKALSTSDVARSYVSARSWDLIYIDGSHDYEVVLSDYRMCRDALAPGGILVMDDSSLGTDYRPRSFSFAGHPGPSRVAVENASKDLVFLARVGHNSVFASPPLRLLAESR